MNFYGYKRSDGRVGIRNKVLILPASVCASDTTRIIAQQVVGSVTFNNQNGCSQVASDQQPVSYTHLVWRRTRCAGIFPRGCHG